jgi:glycosyltransferase involved in cell wall biosynthesis
MTAGLRILYLVPGHHLVDGVGPTRNVLSLARALARRADVAVAFRSVPSRPPLDGVEVLEIDRASRPTRCVDDSATRDVAPLDFVRYVRRLRDFVREQMPHRDVLLEKSWLLSGYLSAVSRDLGGIGIPVENVVPSARRHAQAGVAKRMRVTIGSRVAGRFMRRAPAVIAETAHLKRDIARVWGVASDRIRVVELGLDKDLFHPLPQAEARDALGLRPDPLILLYVGIVDETHNLTPVIEALGRSGQRDIELHIVGDGPRRASLQALGLKDHGRIVFHGRVHHADVPRWIAAADLCLAPYDASAFATGTLAYSTLKVPEYMSVGRPVATVANGRMLDLVKNGETGFLFDNTTAAWQRFLDEPPTREQLQAMGRCAAACAFATWDDVAEGYLQVCERAVGARRNAR